MLDLNLFRRTPEDVRQAAQRRGLDTSFVDVIVDLDRRLREATASVERLKAEKNTLTGEISKATDRKATAERLRPQIQNLDEQIAAQAGQVPDLQRQIDEKLSELPNLPHASVPNGKNEDDNVLVRSWGTPTHLDFTPKPHWELGEALGIIDFERATKLSGARFSLLRGQGARLARALVNFFLDRAIDRAYTEIAPPALVTRDTMWATGQLSKFADAMFRDDDGDLFLIPTAEVPLTAMHREEILAPDTLPRKYVAATDCFRKEAGAAGRDTRGLIRLHQFQKVELVWLTDPNASFDALEELTANSASLLEALELPHRIMALCAGDMGFNAAKTYDIEVWIPSQNTYREISSCSNCTDFQARRSNIRYRPTTQAKPEFVHTLNGSGLAVGRTIVAILENGQQVDGSIRLPKVLVPYMGTEMIHRDELFATATN
jgi:seryl-tRNA synthetase